KIVSEMWKNLLHVRKIGVNDNFFELGGNSLLAQNFITLLAKEKYLLPITKLYQHPTPARIAAFLEGKSTTKELEDTRKHSQTNDIAVIAMAGRFPGADTIDELWTNLKEGKESIRFFSEEEIDVSIPDTLKKSPNYVKARGLINGADEFDHNFFGINPKIAEAMDPQQRKFLEIAWEALETAGYLSENQKESIGVYAGSSSNTYFINNVHPNEELRNSIGDFNLLTLNDKDFLA